MNAFMSVVSAVFWGLIVLSLLVLVHEGGHFISARCFGMRVTEFFLGLPFRYNISWKSKRFGTEFGVTPILLGGYNRICGMEGEEDELLPRALAIVQREGCILAEDLARELNVDEKHAYELLASLVDMGSIKPFYDPERGEQPWQREWPAAFKTLRRDENLRTEYDSDHDFETAGTTDEGAPRPVEDVQAFYEKERSCTYRGKGFVARVATLLAGPLVNIILAFVLLVGSLMVTGVEVGVDTNVLGGVTSGSYVEASGLREGDTILKLGSHDVSSWTTLSEGVDACLKEGGDIKVAYMRDGETFETVIDIPEDEEVEMLGFQRKIEVYHPSFGEAATAAWSYVGMVGSTVARIVMPQHTIEIVNQSSSIVGISQMASEAAASGIGDLILLAAAISVSLGFMNLLPIPPLDGGKVLIEIVQLVIRRPLSTKAQNAVSFVGLAFFIFIFCFAVRNDIVRIMGLM